MEKVQASTHDMQRSVVLAAASAFYQAVDFFDWESGAHIGTLTGLIAQPHELASDNDNRRLFLTHTYRSGAYGTGAEPGHEGSIIDVDSQSVADVIDIHPFIAPHGVQYNKATGLLFASVEESDAGNGVIIIDPQSRKVLDHIPTQAENSHWVAVTQTGDRCFVTHKEAPFLSVLDVRQRLRDADDTDWPQVRQRARRPSHPRWRNDDGPWHGPAWQRVLHYPGGPRRRLGLRRQRSIKHRQRRRPGHPH